MAPRSRNARGLRTPYVLADHPCVHRQGPDVRLPIIVTFRRDDAAARAVIGPLATDPTQNHKGSRLCRSACVVIALRECGTIISP